VNLVEDYTPMITTGTQMGRGPACVGVADRSAHYSAVGGTREEERVRKLMPQLAVAGNGDEIERIVLAGE
jgi:hypothetical protein